MIIITTITYLNHFDNSFHFDDIHTIVENPNIRSLKNIPTFFTDGTTISSLPQNQTYRPVVTTSLAFDYWLGGGYDLLYFHLTSFILFLIQGILIFLFVKKIIDISFENKYNFYVAAGITLWYMVHPVMAETVNYIIARSDLQSTFFVLLAFVLYQYSAFSKKYYLYLIPILIGTLAKPTAIMFAPLFFCYVLLFEENISFLSLFSKKLTPSILRVIKVVLPVIIFCLVLYIFHNSMTPDSFKTGSSDIYNYLITQPYVILYYFGSMILPIHLSADTDWVALETIWSFKFIIGALFVIILIIIAFYTSKTKKYIPISFGIAWFFIALAPTSSIIPLAEVMNDHRMFFPYVGLIISLGWSIKLLIDFIQRKYPFNTSYIPIIISSFLVIYAFGTYQRNKVWHDDESLWKDVTIKSPKNARGLMNYGITKMEKGEYDSAETHFKKALVIKPYYPFLHINLGILFNLKGNKTIAEEHFKKAIQYGGNYFNSWFYYGRFLWGEARNQESIEKLSKSLELSPYHIETRRLLMENYLELEEWDALNRLAHGTLQIEKDNKEAQVFLRASIQKISKLDIEEREIANAPSLEKYLNLSFKYYQNKQYQKCIETAEKALELKPTSFEAYNNICIANNLLGKYDLAIDACSKALDIKPDFDLAKNNLNDIFKRKNLINELKVLISEEPNETNYLNLSLQYFNYGLFENCIKTSKEGIIKHPTSDKLYNNLCAAYNSLKKWSKAVEVGKKGLEINPNNQLLRNNYNWAVKNGK
ncbi:hypothetical protein ATO12_18150 [Aquimarina atlantica]|uniref:Uncharacterized protein n=2 Tax=Aquimarina atlantica TaxID=1317122 RepID=A0A023BSY9_9FLAO|nr:hypothetical protein ATO12_18150 [Aquimarina atlantica]